MKFPTTKALVLIAALAASVACKKKVHVQCSDTPKSVRMNTEPAFYAVCPAGCSGAFGSVWGQGPYTTDSAICRAAIHAGALDDGKGGKVTVAMKPGQGSYSATVANGIASSAWGSYDSSFEIK